MIGTVTGIKLHPTVRLHVACRADTRADTSVRFASK
jgi:hypothetical protein